MDSKLYFQKINSTITRRLIYKVLLCSIFISISALPIILNASALGPDTWTNLAGYTLAGKKMAISILSPNDGQNFDTQFITVNGDASNYDGDISVTVKVGGVTQGLTVTGGPTWTFSHIELTEGSNNITAIAIDASNNPDQTSINVIYTPPDTTNPFISIISPTEGQEFTTSSITVNGSASDNKGLSKVEVKVGAGSWVTVTGGASWTYSSITLIEGTNTITARATDTSDNTNQTSVNVKYTPPDTAKPVISIISPIEGQELMTSSITVNGTASDDKGLGKVEVKVGAGSWLPVTGTSSWTISSITLIEGTNNITARATDTSNNSNETSINVNYSPPDTAKPILSITSPKEGKVFTTSSITVNGTASDDKGLNKVEVKVGAGSWLPVSGTSSWTISSVTLIEGTNNITARATDTSNNSNETSVTVTYAKPGITNPFISITSPTNGTDFTTSSITVSGTALNNSTFRMVEVNVNNGTWKNASGTDQWNITVELSAGSNTIYARANYSTSNSDNTSVTVTYTPTESNSGGGGGSNSGGGGGGGGGSGEEISNINVNEKYDLPIYKDRKTTYTFKSVKNPIIYVNVTGNTNNDVITAMVEALKGTSSLVASAAPGNVYMNVNVWVGTSGFATPRNIKEAIIMFRVDNSWIGQNKDIKLLRWDGNEWITLKTSEIMKDETFTYFEANTDSFSPFAITSLKETPTLESIFSSEKTPAQKGAKTGVNKTQGKESNQPNVLINWFIISGIFVLIGLIIEVVRMKKK
ncbi:MAG: hypothetical protein C3F06_00425 [Candidatus Methanoperedenaceae archaeon]|nr:MAG: hypothetical protein C3F06_00425 [Candidatus Methanoperedenaceae archaeon]